MSASIHRLPGRGKGSPTEDLLHFMEAMIRKAEREPDTARQSLAHAARAFERIVERIS